MSQSTDIRRRRPQTQSIPATSATCNDDNRSLKPHSHDTRRSRLYRLFGVELRDFSTRAAFVRLICRPCDPASLGITRIVFGFLMILDVFQERQFANAEQKWGDESECRFPLLPFLHPLPLQWMYLVYLLILAGACGVSLGLFYRPSCLLLATGHCYLFILDKSSWNNHSYLYCLTALLFTVFDADRYLSVDGLWKSSIHNTQVPLWNYCLIRVQIFLVYFIAGLKKLDSDWVAGYSVPHLSSHWVFSPLSSMLSPADVDLWVVHRGGLVIDLFVGFFLFFDRTRPAGFIIATMFHSMNSQIFSICMFPYMMMATMPLFCSPDWPKRFLRRWMPCSIRPLAPSTELPQYSGHCLYPKELVKAETQIEAEAEGRRSRRATHSSEPSFYHKGAALYTIVYVLLQSFMPYSHFLTPGYNNWTNGLYGYSWDMMVYNWHTQHIRITYEDQETGESGFINPQAWTHASTMRWTSQADMVKQYAVCVAGKLEQEGLRSVAVYVDVWRSLNSRFQQRLFDPRVDLVTAPWSPFRHTPWLMPLLTNLSSWREHIHTVQEDVHRLDDQEASFIADFPGLTLENFVHNDFGKTSIEVMSGAVEVSVDVQGVTDHSQPVILQAGERMQVAAGVYHRVKTVSSEPSSFVYRFVNTTDQDLMTKLAEYESRLNTSQSLSGGKPSPLGDDDEVIAWAYSEIQRDKMEAEQLANQSTWFRFTQLMAYKINDMVKSLYMGGMALLSLATGEPFDVMITGMKDSHATS